MAETVREALDDRVHLRAVVSWIASIGVLLWVFDEPVLQVGTTILTAAVLGTVELLSDAYDLRSELSSFGTGLIMLFGAVALAAFGDNPWMGLVPALIGGWMTLDAGQTIRHEGLKTDETPDRDGHEIYQEYVTRQVDTTLREEGLTHRELAARLEADDAAIDRALSTLDDRGLLTRHGSELRVSSPPKPGVVGRVRNGIGRGVGRLARPLTIEFENESDDAATARREVGDTSPDGDHKREPAGRH